MGDTFYPNFLLFTMDEFYRNLCLYYWNSLSTPPRIDIRFKASGADTLQGNDLPEMILEEILQSITRILSDALSARIRKSQSQNASCTRIVDCNCS